MLSALPVLLAVAGPLGTFAKELTLANWDKETAGKQVFVKFQAPCVFDVDCTESGKDLCEKVGVTGYPTIKHGAADDMANLQSYEGGRDLEALRTFAKENLGPVCGMEMRAACTDAQNTELDGFLTKPATELEATIKKLEKEFVAKMKKLDKKVFKLKEKRQEFEDDRDEDRGKKPKKGKENEFEAKKAKMKERKAKLDADQDAIATEGEALDAALEATGIRMMKIAAKANKDKHKEL